MKNIEILYTCDMGMSEEPIFSYTFLEYVRAILKSIESSILLSTSSYTRFSTIICSYLDMKIQNEIEKTEMTVNNRSWSCRESKGGLYYEDACHSCCSLYQNEQWEDSYVLALLLLSFCSALRGPFRQDFFRRRTCPSRALCRVRRLHALYDCHSLICFVNSYIVILFVYMYKGFAEKGLPMLWCSSRRAQVGCLCDSATACEVENRVSLRSWQDACYSNSHNLNEK
jgi:hypothetical protein